MRVHLLLTQPNSFRLVFERANCNADTSVLFRESLMLFSPSNFRTAKILFHRPTFICSCSVQFTLIALKEPEKTVSGINSNIWRPVIWTPFPSPYIRSYFQSFFCLRLDKRIKLTCSCWRCFAYALRSTERRTSFNCRRENNYWRKRYCFGVLYISIYCGTFIYELTYFGWFCTPLQRKMEGTRPTKTRNMLSGS